MADVITVGNVVGLVEGNVPTRVEPIVDVEQAHRFETMLRHRMAADAELRRQWSYRGKKR